MKRGQGHSHVSRSRLAAVQPRKGDLVLACPHLEAPGVELHFYSSEGLTMRAPDGRHVTPRFMVPCATCLRMARNDPQRVAYSEVIWQSNVPIIMAAPKGVPSDITTN